MSLDAYRIFHEVGKTGNMTRASELLFISQPAVSKAIGQLEELFHRCNQARYAASQMGGDLQAELARVDAVLRAVKNMSFSAPKK